MAYKERNIAFLFPGQGAQYVGMAMDYINDEYEAILKNFDEKNGTTLYQVMKDGPEETLTQTTYTQPAILFHSIAAMRALQEKLDIAPDVVAGHSLGEFTALVANGVLELTDAMNLVHKRGDFMIRANDGQPFGMTAIVGLSPDEVRDICKQAQSEGVVIAANFNTPVQTVISGSKAGVDKAGEIAKEKGAKRVIPLMVGGPFHSPLIARAGEWLAEEIEHTPFNFSGIPIVSNVDAKPVTALDSIKKNLALQVTSTVQWVQSMELIIDKFNPIFIEFGPQRVLAGMMKKINRAATIYSIDKMEDVETVCGKLEEL